MTTGDNNQQPPAQELIDRVAELMRGTLAELAQRLRPFPAFLNMTTLQAIELDPPPGVSQDRGCVVVLPGGEIFELDLVAVPGVEGIQDIDSVEEFQELEMPSDEYVLYAAAAINLIIQEMGGRPSTGSG